MNETSPQTISASSSEQLARRKGLSRPSSECAPDSLLYTSGASVRLHFRKIGTVAPYSQVPLDQIIGVKGQASGGVYQFGVPRRDPITENGMQITPAGSMGVATAINFQPTGSGRAAITGDFVLTAEEVNPVIRVLRANGIEVTAIHSHMLTEQLRLIFMHFWANGDAIKLARGLRAALYKTASTKS